MTSQFAIEYIQEGCEDCPEFDAESRQCLSNSHCFEVKYKAITALKLMPKYRKELKRFKQKYLKYRNLYNKLLNEKGGAE